MWEMRLTRQEANQPNRVDGDLVGSELGKNSTVGESVVTGEGVEGPRVGLHCNSRRISPASERKGERRGNVRAVATTAKAVKQMADQRMRNPVLPTLL
jgi:hypothetical protein